MILAEMVKIAARLGYILPGELVSTDNKRQDTGFKLAINELLRDEIRTMTRHSPIYKVLKEELSVLGYWKNKPRGNPKKGFEMRGKKNG